jgi:D-3-phosphoglycerate dehydrogenase
MEKIVLCYPATPQHVEQIQLAAPGSSISLSNQNQIRSDIDEATIFCGHARGGLNWNQVIELGRLKWIQSSAAGLDHCLHPPVINSNVVVSGASVLFADQVAEQTLALLLALIRKIPSFILAQQQRVYERMPTDDLRGKTVGIVGFGGNGQRIAQVLKPFGLNILATDCFADLIHAPDVELLPDSSLDDLFARSQVVIVTLPLTPQTEGLIGERQFSAMPRGGYFINVGRGQVVKESDLVGALQHGRLCAAGLDVVASEPLSPDSPLWLMDNVLITPHVGAQSYSRNDDVTNLFCENLRRWREGIPLLNWVDKVLGYPRPEHRVTLEWLWASRK